MSTSGWVVALLFGFGVLFWLWSDRSVTEQRAQSKAELNAETARFDADWERMRTGQADAVLESRAAEARAKAAAVAIRNEEVAQSRETSERAITEHVEGAMGVKPSAPAPTSPPVAGGK